MSRPPSQALLGQALRIIGSAEESSPPPFDVRLSCAKMLMEVEQPAEALELLQVLRLEHDDSLEVWYLTCCAALQAGEAGLAREEAAAACAYAQSEACPEDEKEWLAQLLEIEGEARAACEAEGGEPS